MKNIRYLSTKNTTSLIDKNHHCYWPQKSIIHQAILYILYAKVLAHGAIQ